MTALVQAAGTPGAAPAVLPASPVAITGCGVVSPAGAGLDALGALLATGTPGHAEPPAGDDGAFPPVAVRTVPDVSPADYVGRKGTRRLDRMVGFGLVATHLAVGMAGRENETSLRDRTGVAVGTSTGSIRSVWELASSTYPGGPSYIPSRFPNSVMNSCAGQIAVWNSFKAANATLASGHASSAAAFRFARNAIRTGQAQRVLVGGVEELCPHLAWGWHASGTLGAGAVLGEGAAMLVAEDPAGVGDRAVLAELLAAEVAHVGARTPAAKPAGLAGSLALCIARALTRSEIGAGDVGLVSLGAGGGPGTGRSEADGVARALGAMPATLRVADVVGDAYSAAGALQAAAVIARWSGAAHAAPPAERYALVTSVGADGNVGCVVLRRPEPR